MEFKSVNNLEFNSAVLPTNGLCRGVGGANILWRLINLLAWTNVREEVATYVSIL